MLLPPQVFYNLDIKSYVLLSLLKIELIQKEIICETEDTEVKGKLGKEYCVGEYESNSWCVRVVIL